MKEVYSLVYTGSTLQSGEYMFTVSSSCTYIHVAVFIVEDVQCSGTGASQFLYSIYIIQNLHLHLYLKIECWGREGVQVYTSLASNDPTSQRVDGTKVKHGSYSSCLSNL